MIYMYIFVVLYIFYACDWDWMDVCDIEDLILNKIIKLLIKNIRIRIAYR